MNNLQLTMMEKNIRIPFIKVCALTLFMLAVAICHAQQIPNRPSPPRLVNDFTNTLTASQVNNLEYKLRNYNDTTSTQIAVVFVNDLQGTTVADFAYQLGEKWGVGTKKNNGIVILVKPKNETKGEIFISVGYGLEPYIPDAIAKRIIENEMIPAFKKNDYFSGVNNAIDIIIGLASGSFSAKEYSKDNGETFILIFFIIMMILMITFITFAGKAGKTYSSQPNNSSSIWNALFWASVFSNSSRHNHHNHWGGFSGGSGGFGGGSSFGGFGGGSFGGGGAGGSW